MSIKKTQFNFYQTYNKEIIVDTYTVTFLDRFY